MPFSAVLCYTLDDIAEREVVPWMIFARIPTPC